MIRTPARPIPVTLSERTVAIPTVMRSYGVPISTIVRGAANLQVNQTGKGKESVVEIVLLLAWDVMLANGMRRAAAALVV